MPVQKQTRQLGDTLIAIAGTLKRPNGDVVNPTGLTVKFTMVDSEGGTVKVAETSDNVSVTDAAAGEVQYDPQAADVNEEGTFYAYFVLEDGSGNQESFPVKKGDFRIIIDPLG